MKFWDKWIVIVTNTHKKTNHHKMVLILSEIKVR